MRSRRSAREQSRNERVRALRGAEAALNHRTGSRAGRIPGRDRSKPVAESYRELCSAGNYRASSSLSQFRCFAALIVARTEHPRCTKRCRLENRVQAGGLKSSSDVSNIGQRVEVAEYPVTVNENYIGA